jgi:lipopolysaccharide export system permease protein
VRIVSRYLLWEFLKVLSSSVLVFLSVFFLIDFMDKIDNFIAAEAPAIDVVYFFLAFTPTVIYFLTPVAVLVSIMIAIGLLARNSEITACKAGGISLVRLSMPIILASILISVLSFVLQDALIPKTVALSNSIWARVAKEKPADSALATRDNLWFRSRTDIYNIQSYDEKNRVIQGLNTYKFDPNFTLRSRLVAESARQGENGWEAANGLIKEYRPGDDIVVEKFRQAKIDFPEVPDQYAAENRPSEELSTTALKLWIERMESEGYDPIRYVVDLHFKYSFPFICTIMALLGLPIAFWKERGGGIALGIGAGLALSFVYLVFLGLSRSLGYSAILPPYVAAWLPNVFFTIFGAYLFTRMKQ